MEYIRLRCCSSRRFPGGRSCVWSDWAVRSRDRLHRNRNRKRRSLRCNRSPSRSTWGVECIRDACSTWGPGNRSDLLRCHRIRWCNLLRMRDPRSRIRRCNRASRRRCHLTSCRKFPAPCTNRSTDRTYTQRRCSRCRRCTSTNTFRARGRHTRELPGRRNFRQHPDRTWGSNSVPLAMRSQSRLNSDPCSCG